MAEIYMIGNQLSDINVTVLIAYFSNFHDNNCGYRKVYEVSNDVEIHDYKIL